MPRSTRVCRSGPPQKRHAGSAPSFVGARSACGVSENVCLGYLHVHPTRPGDADFHRRLVMVDESAASGIGRCGQRRASEDEPAIVNVPRWETDTLSATDEQVSTPDASAADDHLSTQRGAAAGGDGRRRRRSARDRRSACRPPRNRRHGAAAHAVRLRPRRCRHDRARVRQHCSTTVASGRRSFDGPRRRRNPSSRPWSRFSSGST